MFGRVGAQLSQIPDTGGAVTERHDVLVVGGGPAGAATALALAQKGFSVALLEKTNYDVPRFGETLPPAIIRPLMRLGVWDKFLANGHQPVSELISIWGSDQPQVSDSIFNPYGPSWHLDRARFDRLLADGAEASGVVVHRGAQMKTCHQYGDDSWHIVAQCDGSPLVLGAAWLIDATGRAASVARRQRSKRLSYDRLVALARFGSSNIETPYTAIEGAADGWWYAATLPADRAVVGFFTDIDLLPRAPSQRVQFWTERFRRSRVCAFLNKEALASSPLKVVPASSSRLDLVSGPSWLAVGDAAQSYDPLSGEGITKALWSGLAAADTIAAFRCDGLAALKAYSVRADRAFDRYLTMRANYYARENRWPTSTFWRRRSVGNSRAGKGNNR